MARGKTIGGARRPLGGVVQRRYAGAVRSVAASVFVLQSSVQFSGK